MTMWGGRFTGKMDPDAWVLNASLSVDRRLAAYDVRGSIAWAKALLGADALTPDECHLIVEGLEMVAQEMDGDSFVYREGDEDIHTAVERRLGELIGPLSGKLHTGRSRNDQVATDFRLWMMDAIDKIQQAVIGLQKVLVIRAENDMDVVMPGYTHLQRAQPVLLSHWWLSHFWPLQRDRERLESLRQRVGIMPLGCGALAGSNYPVDRTALAEALGFSAPAANSLDAISDRDFAAELLFCTALIGTHLSRLAEAVVIFTTAEFGFFELSDAYATGSSLMPQKKNPDVFELARGKAGTLDGLLSGLLATLKGLPSTYDKDLQEDKAAGFTAYDLLWALLPVLAGALGAATIHPERMRLAIDASLFATDLADYLVERGVPFRLAHTIVGKAVQLAAAKGTGIDTLSLDEYHSLVEQAGVTVVIGKDLYSVFDPSTSVARRRAIGGTAPEAVMRQLGDAKAKIS